MHVDVDFLRVAIEKQESEGVTRGRHQVKIRRRNGVQQQTVPNQPAIDEQIDGITIHLLHRGRADEASQAETAGDGLVVTWM